MFDDVMVQYDIYNLKEIVNTITRLVDTVEDVYLFGSRAYKTCSLRSDIDLLIISNIDIPDIPLRDEVHQLYPPVDLFISTNYKSAKSMMNGSVLNLRKQYDSIINQIDAILLWSRESGFNDEGFYDWNQNTKKDADFKMSILPSYPVTDVNKNICNILQGLHNAGIYTFFAGTDYNEIAQTIINVIDCTFIMPQKYAKKAKNFSYDCIKIKQEYDFQNLVHMILRPMFPDIEPEPVEVIIDGNKKAADFGLLRNKIVIEAKHITDNSKKLEVLKTLDGLDKFYCENPNIQALAFLILYEEGTNVDPVILEGRYTDKFRSTPIFTKFIKNIF